MSRTSAHGLYACACKISSSYEITISLLKYLVDIALASNLIGSL